MDRSYCDAGRSRLPGNEADIVSRKTDIRPEYEVLVHNTTWRSRGRSLVIGYSQIESSMFDVKVRR